MRCQARGRTSPSSKIRFIANEKQIRQDTEAASQAADDAEAQKLLAHAESLRVTNSLLAARIDQLNLQSKYLMQDQKKVGPNLKDVRLKLRKEWIPVWLRDPQAFRPGTKMPTFWRFAETDEPERRDARQGCGGSDPGDFRVSLAGEFRRQSARTGAWQCGTWQRTF